MSKQLTILFTPLDAFGHVNPSIGIAQQLHQRGHRIVFSVGKQWKDLLQSNGFETEIVGDESQNVDPSQFFREWSLNSGMFLPTPTIEKAAQLAKTIYPPMVTRTKIINDQVKVIVNKLKPDVIVFDNIMAIPSLFLADCPKVMMIPSNPMFNINADELPPALSGYPIDGNRMGSEWVKFKNVYQKAIEDIWQNYHDWMKSFGLPDLPKGSFCYSTLADLAIYSLPKELDYHGCNGWTRPDNWLQFDSFMRIEVEKFELPKKLKNRTGKLIYFSLGTLGSADINLVQQLLGFLADSEYRVIVVKGFFADQCQVPDNGWGEAMLPQIQILPHVDLYISHGGNNGFCEGFYFGKPMIIMPLFGDQFDNAQRLVETGLGIHLDPFQCTKQELLEAIDKLLNDQKLALRLKKISKRAQEEVKSKRVAKVIEEIVGN